MLRPCRPAPYRCPRPQNRVVTAIVGDHGAHDVNIQRVAIPNDVDGSRSFKTVIDEAVVAEHDIHAGTGVHGVPGHSANQDVVVDAGRDRVSAADGSADALTIPIVNSCTETCTAGRRCGRGDLPAVAEDDVLAVARVDRVVAGAAEDDVVAVAGGDGVVAAHAGGERPDAVDVVRARRVRGGAMLRDFFGEVVDQAVVAEDDVVAVERRRAAAAGEGVDGVVAAAAEDHVAADAGGDRVVAVAELVGGAVDRAPSIDVDQAKHLHLVVVVGLGRDPDRRSGVLTPCPRRRIRP